MGRWVLLILYEYPGLTHFSTPCVIEGKSLDAVAKTGKLRHTCSPQGEKT
jgi:hypothetical protein